MVHVPAGNDSAKRPRALSPVEITDDHYRQMLKRHKRRKCEEPVSSIHLHLLLCLTVHESVSCVKGLLLRWAFEKWFYCYLFVFW